ncbi:hypothetical protein J4573_05180 [Actinomadura barringtoniae]|uniref:Uncharacterized protein n=1 Tax=Actinomadura barringtoniae TaxID=1427535 RepID=A0A939P6L2_9ACTN|nr:hypothetical protein [Actinomadura barringtoniae]MBO2446471.1 hypothetical protein [Actinomadura barringtoniae]
MYVIAATAQLLVAASFLSIPALRHRFGASTAKANAEAELTRQGFPTTVLAENKLTFDASGHETAVPATVAALMIIAAAFNLIDPHWGQLLTWVFSSLILLGNALILWSQLTAVQSVEKAFQRKGDPTLQRIDVRALLKAAESGFPTWTPTLQKARHTTVFAASLIALLTVTFA